MTALLALASAVFVGGADFLGGVTSRRVPAARIAAFAQACGLVVVVPVAVLYGATRVTGTDAAWSVASGVAVGLGLMWFYRAMALGLISVVAPVAAVIGASIPLFYALAIGERPGAIALIGIAVALGAVAIVSIAPSGSGVRPTAQVVGLALSAGVAFGLFYVFLARTSDDAGLWPAAFSRVGSTIALVALAARTPPGIHATRTLLRPAIVIGVLEVAAIVTLLLALQRGPISVAAVLASLYPVTTVLLAAALLHERLTRPQLAGVVLALLAIGLVSTG